MGLVFVCWACGRGWTWHAEQAALRCPNCLFQPLVCVGNIPGVQRPLARSIYTPITVTLPPAILAPLLALPPPPPPVHHPPPLPFSARNLGDARRGLRSAPAPGRSTLPTIALPPPGSTTQPYFLHPHQPSATDLALRRGTLNQVAQPNVAPPNIGLSSYGHQQPFRSVFSNSWAVTRLRLKERSSHLLSLSEPVCLACRPLGVEALCRLVDILAPSAGPSLQIPTFASLLTMLLCGASPIPVIRLPALIALLAVGGQALAPIDVSNVFARLIKGTKTNKLSAISPTQAETLVLLVCATLPPSLLLALLDHVSDSIKTAVRPCYLFRCRSGTLALPAIGGGVPTAVVPLCTSLHTLHVVNAVAVADLRELLVACDEPNLSEPYCLFLFQIWLDVRNSVNKPRRKRLKAIASGAHSLGQGITVAKVFETLRRLHHSGRFGSAPFAAAGVDGPSEIVILRNVNGVGNCRFVVSEQRINYFCNAHTYACLNFGDRLVKLAPNASNEFWSDPTTSRVDVVNALDGLLRGAITAACDSAANSTERYAETVLGSLEIGLRYHGVQQGQHNFSVTHFTAVGQDRVARAILEFLKDLL